MALLLGAGVFFFLISQPRTDEPPSITGRVDEFVNDVTARAKFAASPSTLRLDPPRTWTDVSGKTMQGVLLESEQDTALIRVLTNQRVYRVPFQRLSEADRSYLAEWASPANETRYYPIIPDRWPVVLGGASVPPPVERLPDGGGWKSAHYDFLTSEPVDPNLIRELAHTCETLHSIAGQTPLPLRWGRPHNSRRQVNLYTNHSGFRLSGMPENWGGAYNPVDNKIHFPLTSLAPVGEENAEEYDASRRKTFKTLVHELAHQESVSILVHDCPTWCGEGIAELFSAMQRAPGVFVFNNPQLSIKRQIYHLTGIGRYSAEVRIDGLPIPKLDGFFDISLGKFNASARKSEGAGISYYAGSLLLVDYFCFADGNSLRPYLEAVLTGVPAREAAETHLLRGRSLQAIEDAMIDRWENHGVRLEFKISPSVSMGDFEIRRNPTFDRYRR